MPLVVPSNRHEAEAIEYIDALAKDYAHHMCICFRVAQKALNALIDAGIDQAQAVQIVNLKFAVPPPKNVGVESETAQEARLEPMLEMALRPDPDDYDGDDE